MYIFCRVIVFVIGEDSIWSDIPDTEVIFDLSKKGVYLGPLSEDTYSEGKFCFVVKKGWDLNITHTYSSILAYL